MRIKIIEDVLASVCAQALGVPKVYNAPKAGAAAQAFADEFMDRLCRAGQVEQFGFKIEIEARNSDRKIVLRRYAVVVNNERAIVRPCV
jgi:hypothetical protein